MKNAIIALAMTASLMFVGAPAHADDVPVDPNGNPTTTECGQAYEDAYTSYNELQWQIELNYRAQAKIERKDAKIRELKAQIRHLKHRLNK